MEKLAPQIQAAILVLQEALIDAEKFDAGTVGAPGTRLRKAASDLSNRMKEARMQVNSVRAARKAEKK